MEQIINNMILPASTQKPEIDKGRENVKAAHLSSNPINGSESNDGTAYFEVEVENAFFRIFFGC